jgi:hypothetical protein
MPSATTNAESGTISKNRNNRKVGEPTRYISLTSREYVPWPGHSRKQKKKIKKGAGGAH